MNRFYLGLKRGTLQKSVYPLEGSVTIGRSGENDITLVDFDVSHVVPEKNALKLGIDFVETPAEDKMKLQKFLYGQTHTIG